jgi:hypothetical protein
VTDVIGTIDVGDGGWLMREDNAAQADTDPLGIRYADRRLRMDLAAEVRHLTGRVNWR